MVKTSLSRLVLGLGVCGYLVGCGGSTDSREHQRQAEKSLVAQAAENGVTLSSPSCDRPASSAVGATLSCTAEDRDGFEFEYTLTIRGNGRYDVTPLG
jgi:hypothetical protein